MPEFIRPNRDGAYGTSDTYTVCRLDIVRERLIKEIDQQGLHPGYQVGHRRDERVGKDGKVVRDGNGCVVWDVIDAWVQNRPDDIAFTNVNQGSWPACCPAHESKQHAKPDVPQRRLQEGHARETEFIHGHRDGRNHRNEHYTICRLGVPVEQLAWEVREGLHPGYVVVYEGRKISIRTAQYADPEFRCGIACSRS